MHVEVPCESLQPVVKTAVGFIGKAERPILRNVHLEGTDAGLEVTASDMGVSLWMRLAADVQAKGRVCVDGKNFQRMLESAPSQNLVLKAEAKPPLPPKDLKVRAGKARFQILAEDPNDFPKIPRFSLHRPYVRLKARTLADLIARTAFCAHNEVSHFLMHGLLVSLRDGELRMAATNGQRLGVASAKVESYSSAEPFDADVVVPADYARALTKVSSDLDELLDIQWMANALNIRSANGEVSVRALAGTYPNYEMGIPKNSKKIVLDRKLLIEILKQTNIFATSGSVFVDLSVQPDKLVFSAVVDGAGTSQVEQDFTWEHKPLNIIFSPDFLLQSVNAMVGEKVVLEVEHEMSPLLLRELRDDGLNSFCVYAVVRRQ